ncbi:MAG: tetratricopeptide repeat protein [Paludibacteraceae bacterium]|nr:tetratricopeptide repeat protein [Paludibacteraceae bacterium]
MATKVKQQEENAVVEESFTKVGKWIIDNQNMLMWCLIVVLLIVLGVMAFNNYYRKPRAAAANEEVAKAVVYFAQQDYEKALNGDEEDCIGFLAINDKYGSTKGGKLAALYAGLCEYNLGEYEEAVRLMKKFSADDDIVDPAAKMKIGDAYAQLDDNKNAVAYFEKAAQSGNEVLAPIALKKAGLAYQALGDEKAAQKAFNAIKEKYPQSSVASDIDKYILQ